MDEELRKGEDPKRKRARPKPEGKPKKDAKPKATSKKDAKPKTKRTKPTAATPSPVKEVTQFLQDEKLARELAAAESADAASDDAPLSSLAAPSQPGVPQEVDPLSQLSASDSDDDKAGRDACPFPAFR